MSEAKERPHPAQFPALPDGTRFEIGFDGRLYLVMGRTHIAGGLLTVATCHERAYAEMVCEALELRALDGEANRAIIGED